jgi:CelD/BcsL family acetyltransferase involved in cellulose biosynthesis
VLQVVEAIADDFAARSEPVDLASIFLLPEGSPWTVALGNRLVGPEWAAMGTVRYNSYATDIAAGLDAWLGQRHTDFRRTVRRRFRRSEEEGFRLFTTVDPTEIMARLPRLQSFYQRRQQGRGGEGYRFDDEMIRAIGTAIDLSIPGRFRLSVLERGDLIIGLQLVLRAGTRMSCWITGYDPEWSRLGPSTAALLEALDAGAQAGCDIADLGEGDQAYKDDFQDAALSLESVTWCRPRLARLMQAGSQGSLVADADGDVALGPVT